MRSKVVHFSLSLGRYDRADPRQAPNGVLAACKNLRVQKDGRLVSRNGYVPQGTSTMSGGVLVPYDLHEYNGRLLCLGNDSSDPFPTDIFEFINLSIARWRGTDVTDNPTLIPFTDPVEVCGISQIGDGVNSMSVAAGGGFVAMSWRAQNVNDLYCIISRQSNGQVIHRERVVTDGFRPALTWSVDSFYLQMNRIGGDVSIFRFTPGTDTNFQLFANVSVGVGSAQHDLVAVSNATNWRIVSAVAEGSNVRTRIYNSSGVQQGVTTVAAILAGVVCVDTDQADNTTNLFTIRGGTIGELRTFNSTTGALTLGPTATTVPKASGIGGHCRVPPVAPNAASIAVIVNDASENTVCQFFSQAAHALVQTTTAQKMLTRSRPVVSTSNLQKRAVVFGALIAPALNTFVDPVTGSPVATNALVYLSGSDALMSTRDVGNAINLAFVSGNMGGFLNLQLDTTTGRLGWLCPRNTAIAIGGQPVPQPAVTIVSLRSTARRQSAQYGGLLYFAGSTIQAYDGTSLTELGFNEIPGIYSITPSAGGALNPSAQYTYTHHWEYTRADGSLEQSPPSTIFQGNTGAGQNRNTLVVATPHSARVALGAVLDGGSVISVISRTVWDPVTSTSGSVFRRCVTSQVLAGMTNYGAPLTIVDDVSDISLASQGVLYTQGEHGELSGPVENDAPEGASYVSSSSARLAIAGLARAFEWTESKEAFLDEPINFSSLSSFYGKVSKPIVGILSLDGVRLIFTRDAIYAVSGAGVDDIGGGRLPPAVEIPSPSGLKDWRSLLKTRDGVYFQLDDEKLYQMPRGSGAPEWAGVDIRDTLTSFPVITGACQNRRDDSVAFACVNAAGNDSRIVVRSLRTSIWSEDSPPLQAAGDIRAIVNVGDGMAYISGAVVYLQSQTGYTDGASSVIATQWKTNPLYPFELGGYGTIHSVLLTAEFRSAGTLALRVSYDDGVSFTVYDSFTVTGLAIGATVQKRWAMQQTDTTSVVFEWTFTPSAVGEGLILLAADLLVMPQVGQLRELDPADQA